MRYYKIVITNPDSGQIIRPQSLSSLNMPFTWGSYLNGKTIAAAQDVLFDIPVAFAHQPAGDAYVRIWGVSVQEISQSFDLNYMKIAVYGGFQKGLPLAKPQQSGLLAQGYIFQCLGNWIGTDQTIDIQIKAGDPPTTKSWKRPPPLNLVLNWPKGTPMSGALQNTLSTAFPSAKVVINISPKLVFTENAWGAYATLEELGDWVNQFSHAIISDPDYVGVSIVQSGSTITVDDATVSKPPKQIAFEDMIGQPVWQTPSSVQTKFAMRADLNVSDWIQFPQAITTQSPQSNSPLVNANATFQGKFWITGVRHIGQLRQADAASWVTVVDAATSTVAAPQP